MILHVNGRFLGQATTGVQRYGRELIRAFDSMMARGEIPDPFSEIRLHVPRVPATRVPDLDALQVHRYGTIGGHAWEQSELPLRLKSGVLFCPGNTAPVLSLYRRPPVVVTIHDLSFRYFPSAYRRAYRLWYRLLTPLIFRRAERIITVSDSEREAITRLYPEAEDRVIAIQNGGGFDSTPGSKSESPLEGPYILYVGSLSRRKNIFGLFEAFGRLASEMLDLRLLIIGGEGGPLARAAISGRAAEFQDRVRFLGQVEDVDVLQAAYRHASCLVFPSFHEASPLPPIEAMSMGCPVVVSDIPSLRERCGPAAVFCDPRDPGSIAGRVREVLNDPDLSERLRSAGFRQAREFSWESTAQVTLGVIASVAKTGSGRS